MRRSNARRQLAKDALFVLIGAVAALILYDAGVIDRLIALLGSAELSSFLAGVFFTSIFTIAPASVALAHVSLQAPPYEVALWGALGAVCGDLTLFFFIRDRFTDDLLRSLKPSLTRHILSSFHLGFMRWLSPLVGALVIASPLPDEFGLALMGMSETGALVLVPISFVGNILGIYAIIWFAHVI